jgi:hypothetical protein
MTAAAVVVVAVVTRASNADTLANDSNSGPRICDDATRGSIHDEREVLSTWNFLL